MDVDDIPLKDDGGGLACPERPDATGNKIGISCGKEYCEGDGGNAESIGPNDRSFSFSSATIICLIEPKRESSYSFGNTEIDKRTFFHIYIPRDVHQKTQNITFWWIFSYQTSSYYQVCSVTPIELLKIIRFQNARIIYNFQFSMKMKFWYSF